MMKISGMILLIVTLLCQQAVAQVAMFAGSPAGGSSPQEHIVSSMSADVQCHTVAETPASETSDLHNCCSTTCICCFAGCHVVIATVDRLLVSGLSSAGATELRAYFSLPDVELLFRPPISA